VVTVSLSRWRSRACCAGPAPAGPVPA